MRIEIIQKLLKQVAIPAVIAGLFTAYGAYSGPENWTFFGSLKIFFPALFFVLYFYGQYKRVEKHTDDKNSFEGLDLKLSTLKEMVEGLAANIASEPEQKAAVHGDAAHSLLEEAVNLKNQGNEVAGLLQAGLAFEIALRSFSSNVTKADGFENISLLELINKNEKYLTPGVAGELHALRKIRNRITHLREGELSDLPDVDKILNGYKWAVNKLEELEENIPF